MDRHGGKILTDQLVAQGVDRVFSVPGESFLAVLDGLYESNIQNVVCRHEGGAAMMAEAVGKMTGRPGVAFVTRGPGATNASSGVHIARQDSTPMVLFIGQIARDHRDREAFQEVDYRAMFGPLAKWVAEIDQTDRIPEYVNRAFHLAKAGRPGPVVLALPEDMLSERSALPDLPPTAMPQSAPPAGLVEEIAARLAAAERPLILAGGSAWSQQAADDLANFAGAWDVPVTAAFRRQGHIDNRHPAYAGDLGVGKNPAVADRLRQADCLLVLGARLTDIATDGFSLIDPAAPGLDILHVHPDPDLPGSVFRTELAVTANAAQTAAALAALPVPSANNGARTAAAHAEYEAWQQPLRTPGAVRMEEIVGWLSANLPEDAIITNGAGNYGAWLHRYFRFKQYGTTLGSTSGSMGYGFPAAIAASLANPGRTVVSMAGDGCFQMTLNELSTAMQYGATPIVIVANNGRYGTIRMHQERSFPGRVSGTDLANPDFAALARSYGGHGEVVEDTAQFANAFRRTQASGTVAVIELRLDPEALTPTQTLSGVRAAALG